MPPFKDLYGSDIADFPFRLGMERMAHRRKVFSAEQPGELAWEAHVCLRVGLDAVQDWPGGLQREIDAMRARWGGSTRMTLYRCVGAIEFCLDHLQEGSHDTAIRDAITQYRAMDAIREGRLPNGKASRRPI